MADNTVQTGADTVATDDVATLNGAASTGVKVVRDKVGFGDDGTYRDASYSFPFPTGARLGGGYVDESGNVLTVKRAFASIAAGSTDANIVTAVGGKKIRVLSMIVVVGATATTFVLNTKPVGAGTAISPTFSFDIYGGIVLPASPLGWFETATAGGLSATTGAGSATAVQVTYVEV